MYSIYNPQGIYPNETRTANGDLTFSDTADRIVQARNNLRYWQDRFQQDDRNLSALREAVAYMIKTVDEETGQAGQNN